MVRSAAPRLPASTSIVIGGDDNDDLRANDVVRDEVRGRNGTNDKAKVDGVDTVSGVETFL